VASGKRAASSATNRLASSIEAAGATKARKREPSSRRAASTAPAALLGLGDELGRVAEGRMADLVLLDAAWNVRLTMVQGRVAFAA